MPLPELTHLQFLVPGCALERRVVRRPTSPRGPKQDGASKTLAALTSLWPASKKATTSKAATNRK